MSLDLFRKTTVVNIKHDGAVYDVYVGRPGRGTESIFGNPHPTSRPCSLCSSPAEEVWHTTDESLQLFEKYFLARVDVDMQFRAAVLGLRGKVLGCFCVRKDGGGKCHALVIARWIDAQPQTP